MDAGRINDRAVWPDAASQASLLGLLRDELRLAGAKQGCDDGTCGHCLVLLDGEPVRSCLVHVRDIAGHHVETFETLAPDESHPLRQAWHEERVAQCGHCQSAQIVAAAHFLKSQPSPTRKQIIEAPRMVICRCATYPRIVHAILRAADLAASKRGVDGSLPISP